MQLKIVLLTIVLALGLGATAAAVFAPTAVSAGPKSPDCTGC